MRKYGIEHFHIELIEETTNPNGREQYWIQYYNSYHYGYNATLGGDGKRYINYNEVVKSYHQTKSMKQTALDLKISPDSVSDILHSLNIDTYQKPKNAIPTNMYSLQGEYLKTFDSVLDAGNYLIKNGLSHCKPTTIRTHISEVCRGKRQTAAGFKWKFAE